MDENDSPPEFVLPSTCVQITEYHDLYEPIITITGKDADDPNLPNGQISYSILNGNEEGKSFIKLNINFDQSDYD